jgi:alcohol dehydrogenase
MKAAIFQDVGNIAVVERPDPIIQESTDAIVRVVLSCVCGSDLWYYRGLSSHAEGSIGHEFIGVVEDVGSEVKTVQKGNFVIAPFAFSDGTCPHCQAGFQTSCTHGGFFGQGNEGDGGQAEFTRVPYADGTLFVVPGSGFSDEALASFLTLSDVMGTGYHAAVSANVKQGHTVAVVGDGAVGLSAVLAARLLGAERIIALSRHWQRQALAREFGATDVLAKRGDDAVKALLDMTNGIGADAVLECVGTNEANQIAFAMARPGAIIGRVGLPHHVEMPLESTFDRNVGMRGGLAPVRSYMAELLDAVLAGMINPGRVFDFTTDLEHCAEAFAVMDERRAIKSLLTVGSI